MRNVIRTGQVEATPEVTKNVQPSGRKIITDNYCVTCVASKKNCVHVTGKLNSLNVVTEIAGQEDFLFVTGKS